jgi:hypothetical protein
MRARIDCSRAKTGGAKNKMAVTAMKILFIVGFQVSRVKQTVGTANAGGRV